jgi:predicted small metal-binding protein
MTKTLDCPMDGCTAHIEAETEDEVMERAAEHAASAHPDVDLDDETVESIRSQIQDA